MEGLENPTPRTLRVMRFKLEANTTLNEQLALQLIEQKRNLASLAFYASRQIVMTTEDYYKSEGELHKIRKRFVSFSEPFHLRPVVKRRQINEQTTRFAFAPVEQATFDAAVSLDPIKGEAQNSWDVRPLPNRMSEQKQGGQYIFIDVPSAALLGHGQREMAQRAMVGKLEMGQLWVHTQSLMHIRDITTSEKPVQRGETEKPADNDEFEQAG